MYHNAAILAVVAFLFAIVSSRVERSWLSGPIVFVVAGFLLGPGVLDVLHLNIRTDGLRVLAEFTLAMVLFADAANADLSRIRRHAGLPKRLLLIGLPLTMFLGLIFAWLLFPGLALDEANADTLPCPHRFRRKRRAAAKEETQPTAQGPVQGQKHQAAQRERQTTCNPVLQSPEPPNTALRHPVSCIRYQQFEEPRNHDHAGDAVAAHLSDNLGRTQRSGVVNAAAMKHRQE